MRRVFRIVQTVQLRSFPVRLVLRTEHNQILDDNCSACMAKPDPVARSWFSACEPVGISGDSLAATLDARFILVFLDRGSAST